MKLSITNHFGMWQFWHMDCEKSNHESPMNHTKDLPENVKEFKCVGCNKSGQVSLENIQAGQGVLEEV